MAELIKTGSEAEWLEARRQGVTASEIAVIMGLSPWDSPYALYHRKLGILPGIEDNAAMERGRVLEPYIAEKFEEAHPELVVLGDGRSLFRHDERPWQMATPDRWTVRDLGSYMDAVVECKSASSMDEWGEPGTDEIPVHYRAQVLWQMDVMNVARAHVAVLDIPRWRVLEYVIEHDPAVRLGYDCMHTFDATGKLCDLCADILMMRLRALEFLERIEQQDAPDVDWRPATIGALKALHPSVTDEDALISTQLAKRYRAAARNHKHWEERKKLYEAQIREAMGSAHTASALIIGRQPVVRRDVYEQRQHVRKATTVDKLVIIPPKEKKA